MKTKKHTSPRTVSQADARVDDIFDAIYGGPAAKDALEANWLDVMAVRRVARALARDSSDAPEALVNECKTTDLKHVAKLLARIHDFDMLAPGVLAMLMDDLLPYLFRRYQAQMEAETLAPYAEKFGAGEEFDALERARQRGRKGDMYAALAATLTKLSGKPEAEVIEDIAQRYNLDPESLRRSIRRARRGLV